MNEPCHCARETETSHPCHAKGYTCSNEGTQRFYVLRPAALAGQALKFSTLSTWACESCWKAFRKEVTP